MAGGSPSLFAETAINANTFSFRLGSRPLLISIPHAGTALPDGFAAGLTADALTLPDTDWHVDRLYDFADELDANVLSAVYSRYLIDLNRDPGGRSIYPDRDTTALCPTDTFDGTPIYRTGWAPTPSEIERRRERYWLPYHQKLAYELQRLRRFFPRVVLYEAHTIRSRVPRFFDDRLPTFNIGTDCGASADPSLATRIFDSCQPKHGYTRVLNGRFRGGYITRQYGRPAHGVHAVQLELTQDSYMTEEPPFGYRQEKAAQVKPVLRRVLEEILAWLDAPHI